MSTSGVRNCLEDAPEGLAMRTARFIFSLPVPRGRRPSEQSTSVAPHVRGTIVYCLSQARRNIPQKTTSPAAPVYVKHFFLLFKFRSFGHFVPIVYVCVCV